MSIRVLVVEDSAVVAEFLNHILSSDPALRVIGTVRNGMEALQAVQALKPDVVTMDVSMPVMDGYEATRRIMETYPVPIVIVSVSVDQAQVATTFRALEAGALAAVRKPAGIGHPDYQETAKALVQTVKLMSEVKVVKRWPMHRQKSPVLNFTQSGKEWDDPGPRDIKIIAMGASTGGPSVLQAILSELPEGLPVPVLVVQHITPGFVEGFARSLASSCKLRAKVPNDGEALIPGHIYLAPDRVHMGVGPEGRIKLIDSPPENGMRPSVSCLFRTVADVFGPRAAGVLLTGMGKDGADGLKLMREKGAVTIVQDEASCVVFGMPGEAIRLGAAVHVFSPDQITSFLAGLMRISPARALPGPGLITPEVRATLMEPAKSSPEILIVEDSPTQAMELKLTLEEHGFQTRVAANGREALDWLNVNTAAALVISDIVMPELDGYEFCRAIRRSEKLRDTPLIMLSNLSNLADILKGLESGASNFMVKPFDKHLLISYIKKELARKEEAEEHLPRETFTIEHGGRKYSISSNVRQLADILLATYGTALHKNDELIKAQTELRLLNEHLEEKVRERTAELTAEIAERRRIEEELRTKGEELTAYSSKLEQSNRDLRDFAFVASHDLQEPVRKILTFVDLLKIHSKDSLDERGSDFLERVDRSVWRMHGLIRDLLKYSQLTAAPENFLRVDLTDLVKEALSDINAYEDPATQIEIGDLPSVEADPVQMRQLFQNLLTNALKYRGEDPPVIRIYSTTCSCESSCEIRVEDNGIGFDECYLGKIFKPFQRLHGRKAPYEGTGMGLAICRRIVERHGGSITARSIPGKGSTFIVDLPFWQPGKEESQ